MKCQAHFFLRFFKNRVLDSLLKNSSVILDFLRASSHFYYLYSEIVLCNLLSKKQTPYGLSLQLYVKKDLFLMLNREAAWHLVSKQKTTDRSTPIKFAKLQVYGKKWKKNLKTKYFEAKRLKRACEVSSLNKIKRSFFVSFFCLFVFASHIVCKCSV